MKLKLFLLPIIPLLFGCLFDPKEKTNSNQPVIAIVDPVDSSKIDSSADLKIKIWISKQKWGANFYSLRMGNDIFLPKEYHCTDFGLIDLSATKYEDYFYDTVCVVSDTIPMAYLKKPTAVGNLHITIEYAYPPCIENNRDNCLNGTSAIIYEVK